jgi:hypothetical protein
LPLIKLGDTESRFTWAIEDCAWPKSRTTAQTRFSTLTAPHIAEIMLGHRMPGAWPVHDHQG